MSGECDKCGEHCLDCECGPLFYSGENGWISVKDKMPPFGEFVEVIYPDDSRLNDIKRDFVAYWKDGEELYWTKTSHDERDWSDKGFEIKYWRPMDPDIKGRKPYLKKHGKNGLKICMKKVTGRKNAM